MTRYIWTVRSVSKWPAILVFTVASPLGDRIFIEASEELNVSPSLQKKLPFAPLARTDKGEFKVFQADMSPSN